MDTDDIDMGQTKDQRASYIALHVALQTMKERCLSLQDRLNTVEDQNFELRRKNGVDRPHHTQNMDGRTETDQLREQVAELTREKFQLTEHIGMVATENRQLWIRLSKLTKDNQTLGISLKKIKSTIGSSATGGHQNLIRSKTFTQNTPNPLLRQRMMQEMVAAGNDAADSDALSLEEISLEDGDQHVALNEPHQPNREHSTRNTTLYFGYLNDESISTVLMNDTKRGLDIMVDIKKELLRQQSDLKVALSGLRQRKVLEVCLNCKNQKTGKGSMADKNLGTSDESPMAIDAECSSESGFKTIDHPEHINRIDIVQQKKMADTVDKMCPMCGKIYSDNLSFEVFQDHVESHFIDDTELDMNEKYFEFIGNTIAPF